MQSSLCGAATGAIFRLLVFKRISPSSRQNGGELAMVGSSMNLGIGMDYTSETAEGQPRQRKPSAVVSLLTGRDMRRGPVLTMSELLKRGGKPWAVAMHRQTVLHVPL